MMPTYLLIPHLHVQGANAQATWWLVNSTPVMACTMFGHALGRHLNQPATGVATGESRGISPTGAVGWRADH